MFAPGAPITIPPMVSVFTKGIGWVVEDLSLSVAVSTAWESANRAIFYPISLASACTVKRVWWANGATVTGGATIEVGVYADNGYAPGARLVYGSATQGTASQVQFVDVTDTPLTPGLYWIAVVSTLSSSTSMFAASIVGAGQLDAPFRMQKSSAQPLPDPAGSVDESSGVAIWLCGFSTTSGTTDVPAPPSTYAPPAPITIPPMVSVFTKGIGWVSEDVATAAPVSAQWEAATSTAYMPIPLPSGCLIKRVWWVNGATVSGGATVQCGVYSDNGYAPGTRLVYGSATQGTATEVQFVDVTDTALPPGLYWIALTASTNTNTYFFTRTTTTTANVRMQQAIAALPATATPAESSYANTWLCGFSTTASP